MIVFAVAVSRAHYPSNAGLKPTVSIVIAARNEEENIRECLDSVTRLSYPVNLLEVVIVDDRSSDTTAQIVTSYAKQHNQIKLIHAVPGTGNLSGKANAVAQGIDASTGEILMFTDADCRVPARWVEETVKYYREGSIGIVAGFTALTWDRVFEAIQSLDWFLLFSVAAAGTRLGFPITAVGNNLSVRRSAYNSVGGYRTISFSVTEDYALFRAITRQTNYRALFPLDPATLVKSDPCRTVSELFHQKTRWFTGGKGMDAKSLALFSVPYAVNALLLINAALNPGLSVFGVFLAKTFVDFFLSLPSLIAFRHAKLARYFPAFELYYIVYVLIFPVLVLGGKETVWKERTYVKGTAKSKAPQART